MFQPRCQLQRRKYNEYAVIAQAQYRWEINVEGGPDLEIQGNVVDHEYRIEEGRTREARVSEMYFRVRDSYGMAIAQGQNDILILAATVAIDMIRWASYLRLIGR